MTHPTHADSTPSWEAELEQLEALSDEDLEDRLFTEALDILDALEAARDFARSAAGP